MHKYNTQSISQKLNVMQYISTYRGSQDKIYKIHS